MQSKVQPVKRVTICRRPIKQLSIIQQDLLHLIVLNALNQSILSPRNVNSFWKLEGNDNKQSLDIM